MATSFFEKLTGASTDEEKEVEIPKKSLKEKTIEKKKTIARLKSKRALDNKKTIKKDFIEMPKTEEEKTMKQSKSKKLDADLEKKPEEEEEEKDWLEEAEGEEGQLTIDVYQTESDIVIKSTIAGVDPEEIDISITNDMVTIKGKRSKDEKVETESYYYQELYWGAFSRSVILPVEVDADRAKASIKNGILTIRLPKVEKVKTKKIKVKAAE